MPTAKKTTPSVAGEVPQRLGEPVGEERLGHEAAAERVEREQTTETGDDSARPLEGPTRLGGFCRPRLDRRAETSSDDDRCGGRDGVCEEHALRLDVDQAGGEGGERAERAGEGGDRVVGAEQARRVAITDRIGEHGLLERGERPGLHDLSGDRAGERGQHEQPDGVGEGEDGSRQSHDHQQAEVPAAASDPIAQAGEQDRHERRAGDERAQDEPDLHAREAEIGERDADENAAETVDEGAERLNEKNPARVCAEPHTPPSSPSA